MSYLHFATLLLVVTVTLGFYLVFVGVRQRRRKPVLGLVHAVLAIAGFIALSVQIATGVMDKLNNIVAFFMLLAIIGGVMVFMLHEEGRPPSMPVVTLHAIMGLVATVLLIVSVRTG